MCPLHAPDVLFVCQRLRRETLLMIRAGALQRGCSQGTLWRLAAEAVLEVSEARGALGAREVHFHMLEGDFKVRAPRTLTSAA